MNTRPNRGFTLIELLVVIAIIAILAAILFPVFAMAKRAAKATVALSDAKQLALAQLMYANDYDDNFSLTVSYPGIVDVQANTPGWEVFPFTYLEQPYMKSWGILLDPTGPQANGSSSGADNANTGDDWTLYGEWGMPPRQAATTGAYGSVYEFGTTTLGALMTNGQLWSYDGIGGVYRCQGSNCGFMPWSSYGYKDGGTPSLTTTAVANPASEVMLGQSATWDFMWQQDNANDFDLYYSGCGSNLYGCEVVITAPVARARDNDGPTVGFYPWPSGVPTQLPTGLTIIAFTDGHSKSVQWRQLMGTTVLTGAGTRAIQAFWPSGS